MPLIFKLFFSFFPVLCSVVSTSSLPIPSIRNHKVSLLKAFPLPFNFLPLFKSRHSYYILLSDEGTCSKHLMYLSCPSFEYPTQYIHHLLFMHIAYIKINFMNRDSQVICVANLNNLSTC